MLFESIKPVLGRSKSLTFHIRGNVLQNFYWYHFSTFICPQCFRALSTFYRKGGVTFSDSGARIPQERCRFPPCCSRQTPQHVGSWAHKMLTSHPKDFVPIFALVPTGFITFSLPTGACTNAAESAVSSKAPINHCNIWNEIPTAELIWKAAELKPM